MKTLSSLRKALATLMVVIATILMAATSAEASVPDAPNPPRLVNDFANILSNTDLSLIHI